MVKKINLAVKSRTAEDAKPAKIRKRGLIPAVIYGADFTSTSLTVKKADLAKVYQQVGESNLINLEIDNKETVKAIIKEVQRNRISGDIQHVDFYVVNMKKTIEVEIPLHFVGEAKAEKELGGYLVKNVETLHVRCLPGDLVDKIDVGLSTLETFADMIKVRDLKVPIDFEVLNHADDMVAHVIESKPEEEVLVAPAEVAPAEGKKAEPAEKKGEEIKTE